MGVAARAGLDFDDGEIGTVPGDEVDVAGMLGAAPTAGNDGVAQTAKVKEGLALAD